MYGQIATTIRKTTAGGKGKKGKTKLGQKVTTILNLQLASSY